MLQQFKLIEKINLTHDVYEMIFEGEKELDMKPGQFVTFLLPEIGGRAYSILKIDGNKIILIIKKRELEDGGRGGSKLICDIEIGDKLKGVGPAGHFILQENNNNKLFMGTGTGFVPLYNQILGSIKKNLGNKIELIFGVRTLKDLFYITELEKIKSENKNFDFQIYISREDSGEYNKGYITDFLTKENLEDFQEFYICGAPAMIDSSVEILEKNGKENIFYEKY